MLCFKHGEQGDICTNRCSEWAECSHRKSPSHMKVPFLVESVDVLVSDLRPDVIAGIHVVVYTPYAIAPQATENDILNDLSPAYKKIDGEWVIFKPSFYSNLICGD